MLLRRAGLTRGFDSVSWAFLFSIAIFIL